MGDDAKRFHDRARDCLNVAKGARHEADRIILEEMAAELEAEAKKIDAEEAAKSKTVEPRQPDRAARQPVSLRQTSQMFASVPSVPA